MSLSELKSFTIYTPVKKLYYTNDFIFVTLLFSLIAPAMVEILIFKTPDSQISAFSKYLFFCVPVIMLTGMIAGITSANKMQPLKGKLEGKLIFRNDRIYAGNEAISINDLRKISIEFIDYKGEPILYKTLDGRKSNGVRNFITIYFNDGKSRIYYFQQLYKHDCKNIESELIQYHLAGKLHLLNLLEILQISDYDEIQAFKKSLQPDLNPK